MTLDFIITIDPVKPLSFLNLIIHSLNLQTNKNFQAIFFNQTLMSEQEVMEALTIRPNFSYKFFSIDQKYFFGKYPIWNLYAFHDFLLEQGILTDYSMSLHMEEFLDVDYVEQALKVLDAHQIDILFGNLSRTQLEYDDIQPILNTHTPEAFNHCLQSYALDRAHHWTFTYHPMVWTKKISHKERNANLRKIAHFGLMKQLRPTARGYTKLGARYEDVHFMKREFAERHNWFLRGHAMYLYDIHICEQPVICELSKELQKVTAFPLHFNRRKIYHINHKKFYFQFEDEEFTTQMLKFRTNDPILQNLQQAITMYREKTISLTEAILYTRKNTEGTGSQDLDYLFHMKYLNKSLEMNEPSPPGLS